MPKAKSSTYHDQSDRGLLDNSSCISEALKNKERKYASLELWVPRLSIKAHSVRMQTAGCMKDENLDELVQTAHRSIL